MRSLVIPVAMAITLATCAAPQPAPAPPAPRPPVSLDPPPPPPPQEIVQPKGDWTDWPIMPGSWVYRRDDRGSITLFGEPGKDAVITLRCDASARKLYFSRAAFLGGSRITVRTSSIAKTFDARNTGGKLPYLAFELVPNDPVLDAMAFSRGRIAVQAYGEPFVAIPVWSEIGRVVEDCRA